MAVLFVCDYQIIWINIKQYLVWIMEMLYKLLVLDQKTVVTNQIFDFEYCFNMCNRR